MKESRNMDEISIATSFAYQMTTNRCVSSGQNASFLTWIKVPRKIGIPWAFHLFLCPYHQFLSVGLRKCILTLAGGNRPIVSRAKKVDLRAEGKKRDEKCFGPCEKVSIPTEFVPGVRWLGRRNEIDK